MRVATAPRAEGLALALACGGTFLSFLDVTVTNLAMPAIGADFGAGVTSLSWVITIYAIAFAALLAPAGAIADVVMHNFWAITDPQEKQVEMTQFSKDIALAGAALVLLGVFSQDVDLTVTGPLLGLD